MADEIKLVIQGDFWLVESDPFEPTGIDFDSGRGDEKLNEVLATIGVMDGKENKVKLRLTIERL